MGPSESIPRSSKKLSYLVFQSLSPTSQLQICTQAAARIGFPRSYTDLWYDGRDKDAEKALDALVGSSPLKSLLLCGPVGVGKTAYLCIAYKRLFERWATHLAYAMPVHLLAPTFSQYAIFLSQYDLDQICRGRYAEGGESIGIEDLEEVQHLMIDDFGSGHVTDFSVGSMEQLIDSRYANRLPTWVTTNIAPRDLENEKRFPNFRRIQSRLLDTDWMMRIEVAGSDRRKER